MNAIDHLLREPAAQAIGWALLHFIWQGTLVGVVTAVALAGLRKGAADVRYVVATIGLSLMVTLPASVRAAGLSYSVATMRESLYGGLGREGDDAHMQSPIESNTLKTNCTWAVCTRIRLNTGPRGSWAKR